MLAHPSNVALPSLHHSGNLARALAAAERTFVTGDGHGHVHHPECACSSCGTRQAAKQAVWRYRTGRGAELTFADRVAQPLASRLAGADKAGTMSLFHALPTHEQKYYRELALIAIDAYEAAKQQGEIA
jgi:hypothetical protein